MIKVGDKVIVLPIEELDAKKCDLSEIGVHGISTEIYNGYVGKEYIVSEVDEEETVDCRLEDDNMGFYFPIDCLKLVK